MDAHISDSKTSSGALFHSAIESFEQELIDKISKVNLNDPAFQPVEPQPQPPSDINDPIRYIATVSGIQPSRLPKNEDEWKTIFLDAFEDGDDIFRDDFAARAANCKSYQEKYEWLRGQQNKFVSRDSYHVCVNTLVYQEDDTLKKYSQPFSRVAPLGLTSKYAIMAAVIKPKELESTIGKTLKEIAKEEQKLKEQDKTKDYTNFYLYRCAIDTPQVKTETVVMNTAYARNESVSIRKDATQAFEVLVKDVDPCWRLLGGGKGIKLGGKILNHHLSNDGTLAIICESNSDTVHLYNVDAPTSDKVHLRDVRLHIPHMVPDLLCCNDGGSIVAISFNKSQGWVDENDAENGHHMVTDEEKPSVPLPPHVRLYFRPPKPAATTTFSYPSPSNYVPLSESSYRMRVLKQKKLTDTEEYKAYARDSQETAASTEFVTSLVFHQTLNNVLYVCTGDGAIHAMIIDPQTGSYEIGEQPIFLAPSPEEEVAAEREAQQVQKANPDTQGLPPVVPGDRRFANKAREPIWNLLFKTVGEDKRTEPRLVATSHTNLYVRLGLPRDFDSKLEMDKRPEQLHREIGTCVSASTCGNILALHRVNNAVDIGHLSSPHRVSNTRFDHPSVISDMPVCESPYPSIRVFSNRIVVLYNTGGIGFFLVNDDEYQKKYDEDRAKAMAKRAEDARINREKLENAALDEMLKKLKDKQQELTGNSPIDPTATVTSRHIAVGENEM